MRLTACRGLLLSVALLLAACGPDRDDGMWDVNRTDASGDGRTDTGRPDGTGVDVPRDMTPPPVDVPRDTTPSTDTAPPRETGPETSTGMCPSSCTSNAECQAACPMPSSGTVCCVFNTCTTVSEAVCPSAPMDGGGGGSDGFSFDGFSFDIPSFDGFSFDLGFSLDGFSFDF